MDPDDVPVGVVDLRVALAPERVGGREVAVVAGGRQLGEEAVDVVAVGHLELERARRR